MKKFNISLKDFVQYEQIEANTKEEAIHQALEWWIERIPQMIIEESED